MTELRSEVTRHDDGDLLPRVAGVAEEEPVFYWESPADGFAMAGAGSVAEIRASGPNRFSEASAQAQRLLAGIRVRGDGAPRLVGGFSFSADDPSGPEWSPFPSVQLVLPRLLWIRDGDGVQLVRSCRDGDEERTRTLLDRVSAAGRGGSREPQAVRMSDLDGRRKWQVRVDRAREAIASGRLQKVVVARRGELVTADTIDPSSVVATARAERPGCVTFWLRNGRTSFVGSTPERLVRVRDGRVFSEALAGSMRRAESEDEDRRSGERLLACPKNRHEHELVLSAVRDHLAPLVHRLDGPEATRLLSLPETHHLFTPVSGELREPRSALGIAGTLHPTPAVCGVPPAAALRIIEEDEPERGWYAGGVGWMAPHGSGEFVVALRSALITGRRILVWAGAGIVRGSEAPAEFDETEAKMSALFRSLGVRRQEHAA